MARPTRCNRTRAQRWRLDIGILVFREGLECILVLAAITASMTGSDQPIAVLSRWARAWHSSPHSSLGQSLCASSDALPTTFPALDLQAATGLLAVVVLLVIMNWFFHKIYWGGWIRAHNRRRKAFSQSNGSPQTRLVLGFDPARIYFPLSRRLRSRSFSPKLQSTPRRRRRAKRRAARPSSLGFGRGSDVRPAAASPYRKMLITTGILLGESLLGHGGRTSAGDATRALDLQNRH